MSDELRDAAPPKHLPKQAVRSRVARASGGLHWLRVRQRPGMRSHRAPLFVLPVVLVMWACNSEPTSIEASKTPSLARAAKAYTLVDLGTLPGGTESQATDIAPSGKVVGSSTASGNSHAFLWDGSVMSDLGTLGGTFSRATSISPSGQVVGVTATEEQLGPAPSCGRRES